MSHALLTMIAPLAPDRIEEVRAEIDRLGNPATQAVRAALRPDPATGRGIHFVSLHAIRSRHGDEAYLLLEISADGDERSAVPQLVDAIGPQLRRVFLFAKDWPDGADLAGYLRKRVVPVGNGWFGNPGLVFAGTPGFSVGRIVSEGELAERVADLLAQQPAGLRGLDRLRLVREAVREQPDLRPMLEPAGGAIPFAPKGGAGFYLRLAGSFVLTYLWPLMLAVLAWGLFRGVREESVGAFFNGVWNGAWVALLLTLILLGIGYARLRAAEASDAVDGRAPDDAVNAAIFARENRCRQNHMISITERKPGLLRGFTQRLVFWGIGKVAGVLYRPGFLGTIGSIHFARWITVPRSRNLVFLSNYGGSWESYLEDFITRAHSGLTGVWSNTIGFPRATNLVQGGAADSENFKRYARRSMEPTLFWYSAYPELTTAAIRTNAQIRRGLSGAMTEDEASLWLALFGSAERPAAKLVTSEIQSLLFGGMGSQLPFGTCLIIDALPSDREEARQWLKTLRPWIAWNDGRRLQRRSVVTLGLSAEGLKRLGMPDSGLTGFPFAFTGGMTGHGRSQILGDDPSALAWGAPPPDAALLVYGVSQADVDALVEVIEELCAKTGATILRAIPLKEVTKDKSEPFGFVDGVSQPVIRGTYKGLRNADPIHLVEAGEFILGYPDNRGNMPPGPTLPAIEDPTNMLPLVTRRTNFDENQVETLRDVGFNGSFLVIREMEQDVAAFTDYCEAEAARLATAGWFKPPHLLDRDFVAAKMVGRWPDGSSLVRYPYEPKSVDTSTHATIRPETNPVQMEATPVDKPPAVRPSQPGDNDFLFGTEDPEALRCPFGAHIRRANPRDSFTPGSTEEIDISNRHRIMRVGRVYASAPDEKPGILFMCLNGDLERQFEFVQQTWLRNPAFHGLTCELDPLLADGSGVNCSYTIPTRNGPARLTSMARFVTTLGGGYFFLPGKRLIDYLAERQ